MESLREVPLDELVNDIGMKKGHARRLLAALR
eukprot:CAMPEP_0198315662 /NCGR_PEP_ID=MMETSP1450-20131203/5856_1 /TAXON_ID=753684 ORGANISM="Madagascaria erythrocladiodes, Strain CCMP3234" /NCGR_SAMPLE_ID=MMETSP1450 /ASSEMBLY_ACC=CAM_ASM_001115 /LENGTH=31 /DNA_ID= /DNA_START= /DNA_END= /DNA_ORIENTATION=